MIPKIVHFNWFGGNPYTDLVKRCLASWEKHLPDYRIICWNEENFPIAEQCVFVREAHAARKYAFVSDYVQAWALSEFGGIYIDSDVEVHRNLDRFLEHEAFLGFQESGFPFTALWGCEKGHDFAVRLRRDYEARTAFSEETNTNLVTRMLVDHYGVDPDDDAVQQLPHGITLYPSNFFCVDFNFLPMQAENYACHHFNTSWIDKDDKPGPNFYKEYVYKKFMMRAISATGNMEITVNNAVSSMDNEMLLRRIGKRRIILHLLRSLLPGTKRG